MGPKERVLNVLSDNPVDKTPVTSFTQVGIVEAMQKVGAPWPEAHSDPNKMATLGASLYKLIGLEAIRVPFCLTVEAEAIGCKVDMGKIDRQPSIRAHAFESPSEVRIDPGWLDRGRVPVVLKAIELLKEEGLDAPLIVGITGPFTLSGHLIGTEKLVRSIKVEPQNIEKLLDTVVEANISYCAKIAEAGADIITVNEPTASPDLLNPLDFKYLVKPRLQTLANSIKIKKVLHICGSALPIVGDMAACGYDAISIEDKVDITKAKEAISKSVGKPSFPRMTFGGPVKVKIAGNVSTAKTLFMGKPEEVKAEALQALKAGVDFLAPACGLAPPTPLANVRAMVEARDEFFAR
ncbi:MAG: MtaA/CmuA family methyltransferase [Thermoproteota archaeon]|jgi:[methyl-Co(III) methanol-specific corrinoid protein]:coenzyme M methyltransferase|uniref:MtaA/CmuA family methyltransferase n=1 Tax=Candidatus Methanodesulfokora washburnensis TaxID=2478471 RepID=A0A429GGH2_9CREN|nr:methylcobamide:CoM methyltransferase MtaA [Candidatus Methanodesulfokores washburnensis]RSN72854.1 MtaA/CmuA family methyltransferase [Candidatus Methanodesulfokores washburnensis]RZN63731.1 MAG: MtaA/CmuA family methyltransferase [Candidatus Methanodesulfokores washburnensis]TDA40863.1 MAG: MtaA/CmuA family methyltransferase [Candidatus Korarchaeota archaeon]